MKYMKYMKKTTTPTLPHFWAPKRLMTNLDYDFGPLILGPILVLKNLKCSEGPIFLLVGPI